MNTWWWRLAAFSRPYWRGLVAVGVLMLLTASLNALKPWPLKVLVDSVFVDQPLPSVLEWMSKLPGGQSAIGLTAWLAAGSFLLFLLVWLSQTLHAYLQSGVSLRISYAVGARVFERLQQLSLRFHSLKPTGDLIRRVTRDSRCARDVLVAVMLPAQNAVFTVLAMTVMMFLLNPLLTVVTLLVTPAVAFSQRWFYRPLQQCAAVQHRCEAAMQSQAEQALTALPMVQAYRHEAWQAARFREHADQTLAAYFRSLGTELKFGFCVNGSTAIGRAAVMIAGGYLVLQGNLTVGGLLVFMSYVGMLYEPLTTLANLNSNLAEAEASAQRVFEVLDAADAVPERAAVETVAVPKQIKEIRFEGVGFAYQPGLPVLQDLNLEIRAGETVAMVGPSGSGKSTLVSLLMRFFDPCDGRILFNGTDLRRFPLEQLRDEIALLLQDPFLLPVSVAENIAYGQPDATREQIEQAAIAAGVDEIVRQLPEGYETIVGQQGSSLSGGEKQRVAIARAMLKRAQILILDEPTSALDAISESRCVSAFAARSQHHTTLIIAHRLSTIQRADRIVVIDDGKVIESGTHQELLDSGGCYAELCRQADGDDVVETLDFSRAEVAGSGGGQR